MTLKIAAEVAIDRNTVVRNLIRMDQEDANHTKTPAHFLPAEIIQDELSCVLLNYFVGAVGGAVTDDHPPERAGLFERQRT